jgi:glycosyltransferase involved in cell wall biosynthesis
MKTGLHILINAISARLGGGITVMRNLLPALVQVDGQRHQYSVIVRPEIHDQIDPHNPRVRMLPQKVGENPLMRLLWEQSALPLRSVIARADVLFSCGGLAVAAAPIPQVLMIQNMAPFDSQVVKRAEGLKAFRLEMLRAMGIASAHVVKKVVFISEYARNAILPQMHISRDRTACVYLGKDPVFSPGARESASVLLARYRIEEPYLFSVSQFYHYKNIVELVLGFARACRSLSPQVKLVLAGEEIDPDYAYAVRQVIRQEHIEGRVLLIGQVPYEDLPPLYAAASLFLFPSSCENFPNILIEALASGVPALASRLGPMPEIAGEGAAYFDPFDPEDIARAILAHWDQQDRCAALREAGLARSARYSWPQCAMGLLEVLEKAP